MKGRRTSRSGTRCSPNKTRNTHKTKSNTQEGIGTTENVIVLTGVSRSTGNSKRHQEKGNVKCKGLKKEYKKCITHYSNQHSNCEALKKMLISARCPQY